MSKEAVQEMMLKAAQDPALQSALDEALQDETKAVEAFLAAARSHGFEFTAQEFADFVEAADPATSGQLADSELDSVAGGATLTRSITEQSYKLLRTYSSKLRLTSVGGIRSFAEVDMEDDLTQG